MISENNLIGWLCFLRLNGGAEIRTPLAVPKEVSTALMERGWVEIDEDEDGAYIVNDGGKVVSDLYAAEWGIDPVPIK